MFTPQMLPEFIEGFEIEDLYGEMTYSLSRPLGSEDSKVLVLYGPNGTGKTTILKVIRSLLSAEDNTGLRTWLARTPFKRASVRMTSGMVVEATRSDSELDGHICWSITSPDIEPVNMLLRLRDGSIRSEHFDQVQSDKYELMRKILQSHISQVTYLDDRRTFDERSPVRRESRVTRRQLPDGRIIALPSGASPDADDPVAESVRKMMNGLRREALQLSNRGSQGAQTIYSALIDRVLRDPVGLSREAEELVSELSYRLRIEQERSERLAEYGLLNPVDNSKMMEQISSAASNNLIMAATILQPYIDSLSARFDAVEPLHQAIEKWVTNIDKFISPKKIKLKLGDDVQIYSKNNFPLNASALSSGERHLLMMLTQAFLMRSTGGLMLIDEPELSLNSVWQRSLISSIVEILYGSNTQLIVASHSLEIVAQYESSVIELEA